jgi:hypothetical protein
MTELWQLLKTLEWDVKAYEIDPPIGGFLRWGAKIVVYNEGAESVLAAAGSPIIKEFYGKSRVEAVGKASSAMRSWLTKQQAS